MYKYRTQGGEGEFPQWAFRRYCLCSPDLLIFTSLIYLPGIKQAWCGTDFKVVQTEIMLIVLIMFPSQNTSGLNPVLKSDSVFQIRYKQVSYMDTCKCLQGIEKLCFLQLFTPHAHITVIIDQLTACQQGLMACRKYCAKPCGSSPSQHSVRVSNVVTYWAIVLTGPWMVIRHRYTFTRFWLWRCHTWQNNIIYHTHLFN